MRSLPVPGPLPRLLSAAGRARPADVIAELIRSHWANVRVDEAEIAPTHEPNGRLAVVHACIHLDVLLPVDVMVELIRVYEPAPAPRADRVLARLWSGHSYQNGSYAYETTIPGEEIGEPGRLMIRISPAGQHGLATVLAPVTGAVAQIVAGDRLQTASG